MSEVWIGAEALRPLLVPIEGLKTHPKNPRRGDVKQIAGSLARFGQVRPVLVDGDGTIIAGNHTYLGATSLGWSHVAVVANTFATEEEARAYLLADNRLADVGEYDRAELALYLEDLEKTNNWAGTGYAPNDLEHLRALERLANEPPPDPALPVVPVAPAPPPELREVVLLFTEEQLTKLSNDLRILRARFGVEAVVDTVLEAVRREAFRVNQDAAA